MFGKNKELTELQELMKKVVETLEQEEYCQMKSRVANLEASTERIADLLVTFIFSLGFIIKEEDGKAIIERRNVTH